RDAYRQLTPLTGAGGAAVVRPVGHRSGPCLSELLHLVAAARQRLHAGGWYDEADLLETASRPDVVEEATPALGPVLVYLLARFPPAVSRLVAALARCSPTTILVPTTGNAGLDQAAADAALSGSAPTPWCLGTTPQRRPPAIELVSATSPED